MIREEELKDKGNERFIEFSLGTEDYCIPLLMVKEVISVPDTTPIPNAPSYFLGVMNLRGQVISIIDLRKKLGIKNQDPPTEEAVIIVDLGGIFIGVIIDSINKVLDFNMKNEVEQVPEIESRSNAKYITGVYKKEKGLTILLDVASLLDVKHLQRTEYKEAI